MMRNSKLLPGVVAVSLLLGVFLASGSVVSASSDSLTPHDPIHIVGNIDFSDEDNDGVINPEAAGTESEPYIIEDWIIDASQSYGIWIENTTVPFVIKNCVVENGRKNGYDGIYLDNVEGGVIEKILAENNEEGFRLVSASNNTLKNNSAKNNNYGFCIPGSTQGSSDNNTLKSNLAENNEYWGFKLGFSSNSLLEGNLAENNGAGFILLRHSDNIALRNNRAKNNEYVGFYLADVSNSVLESNQAKNNGDDGFLLDASSNNILKNNLAINNSSGFVLGSSSKNLFENNLAKNNDSFGFYLYPSSNNNYMYHNYILNNSTQAHDEGSNHWNNNGEGNYWSDWQPPVPPDPNTDGVIDVPRPIKGGNNYDHHPLVLDRGPNQCELSISVTPHSNGSVAVSSDPSGGTYSTGTEVTVTADPAEGYEFNHWTGDYPSGHRNNGTITVAMDSDKNLTAHFAREKTLSVIDDFSDEEYTSNIWTMVGETDWIDVNESGGILEFKPPKSPESLSWMYLNNPLSKNKAWEYEARVYTKPGYIWHGNRFFVIKQTGEPGAELLRDSVIRLNFHNYWGFVVEWKDDKGRNHKEKYAADSAKVWANKWIRVHLVSDGEKWTIEGIDDKTNEVLFSHTESWDDTWKNGNKPYYLQLSCTSSYKYEVNRTFVDYIKGSQPCERRYNLTTSIKPSGGGSISLDPLKNTYERGTKVTVTAEPAPGYEFDHWEGDYLHLGPYISDVMPGTPAEKAGLQAGDRISSIDGVEIENYSGFDSFMDKTEPGQTITLKTEDEHFYRITLDEHPKNNSIGYLGVSLAELPDHRRDKSISVIVDSDRNLTAHFDRKANGRGKILWKFHVPKRIEASPSVDEGKVYFTSWYKGVYAVNASSGELIWHRSGKGGDTTPLPADNLVCVRTAYEGVYALDESTGELKWRKDYQISQVPSYPPPLFEGKIYISATPSKSDTPYLYCLNFSSGDLKWKCPTSSLYISTTESYMIENKISIVGESYSTLSVRNASTGDVIWKRKGLDLYYSVLTMGEKSIFLVTDNFIRSLSISTGELKWKNDWEGDIPFSPVKFKGRLYIWTESRLFCLDPANGEVEWTRQLGWPPDYETYNLAMQKEFFFGKKRIYAFNKNESLCAIKPSDGEILWKKSKFNWRSIYSLPFYRENTLFVITRDNIFAFDPLSSDLRWKFSFPENVEPTTIPKIVKGRLYQGIEKWGKEKKSGVYCISTKPASVEYSLSASARPTDSGSVTLNPSEGTYEEGTEVTVTAEPDEGYEFDHWEGDYPSGHKNDEKITIEMDSNKELTAHFDRTFDPAVDGFSFKNDYPPFNEEDCEYLSYPQVVKKIEDDVVWNSLSLPFPGLKDLLYMWAYLKIHEAHEIGHCYGMSFMALNYYENPEQVPSGMSTSDFNVGDKDATGKTVYERIDYDQQSQLLDLYTFAKLQLLNFEKLNNKTELNAALDQGLPIVIGLKSVSGGLHSVLAYDYDEESRELSVYDPNYPLEEKIIDFNRNFSFNYSPNRRVFDKMAAMGYQDPNIIEIFEDFLQDISFVSANCPVKLSVVDENGEPVGETLSDGEKHLAVVPTSSIDDYSVKLEGTGEGQYDLNIVRVSEGKVVRENLSGSINPDKTVSYQISTSQGEINVNKSESEGGLPFFWIGFGIGIGIVIAGIAAFVFAKRSGGERKETVEGGGVGKTEEEHYCPRCGSEVKPEAEFCPRCGEELGQEQLSQ